MAAGLLFLRLKAIIGIADAIDNKRSKRTIVAFDEKGRAISYDNKMNEYVNGEKTETIHTYDYNNYPHTMQVGVNSGTVYSDSYERDMAGWREFDDPEYERAVKNGKPARLKYNLFFRKRVTTEIATGKVITCVCAGCDENGNREYRKWYFNPKLQGKQGYNRTVRGDWGIVITKREYEDVMGIISGTASNIPSDYDIYSEFVWNRLYKKRMKEFEREKRNANNK